MNTELAIVRYHIKNYPALGTYSQAFTSLFETGQPFTPVLPEYAALNQPLTKFGAYALIGFPVK